MIFFFWIQFFVDLKQKSKKTYFISVFSFFGFLFFWNAKTLSFGLTAIFLLIFLRLHLLRVYGKNLPIHSYCFFPFSAFCFHLIAWLMVKNRWTNESKNSRFTRIVFMVLNVRVGVGEYIVSALTLACTLPVNGISPYSLLQSIRFLKRRRHSMSGNDRFSCRDACRVT